MQGKLVTSTTSHYPYKTMIQTLLSYGSGAKTSQLTSQLWIKDTAGQLDKMMSMEDLTLLSINDRYTLLNQRLHIWKDPFIMIFSIWTDLF